MQFNQIIKLHISEDDVKNAIAKAIEQNFIDNLRSRKNKILSLVLNAAIAVLALSLISCGSVVPPGTTVILLEPSGKTTIQCWWRHHSLM